MMILTKSAPHITAEAPDRQNHASGVKMPQRFLLNRVKGKSGDLSVVVPTAAEAIRINKQITLMRANSAFIHTA
jgi:hypothetical protein